MFWHEIWMWQIEFLLFHINQSFWSMCIRGFRMGSYVPYMILTSFNIKAIYLLFSERFCQFLPKHWDICRNYVPCLTNFIQLSSIYCTLNRMHTTRLSFHGTAFFPCGTSLLIWKHFIFIFQIGPANSYEKTWISSRTVNNK